MYRCLYLLLQFYLPTRTEVTVDFKKYKTDYHNVKVLPSIEDYGNAYGICGHITSDGKNVEQRMRNNVIESDRMKFAESWQVYSSLFHSHGYCQKESTSL